MNIRGCSIAEYMTLFGIGFVKVIIDHQNGERSYIGVNEITGADESTQNECVNSRVYVELLFSEKFPYFFVDLNAEEITFVDVAISEYSYKIQPHRPIPMSCMIILH